MDDGILAGDAFKERSFMQVSGNHMLHEYFDRLVDILRCIISSF